MESKNKQKPKTELGEEGQKAQTFRYKINKSRDVMYIMVTVVNNTVLYV